jgi:hypothetical protein
MGHLVFPKEGAALLLTSFHIYAVPSTQTLQYYGAGESVLAIKITLFIKITSLSFTNAWGLPGY